MLKLLSTMFILVSLLLGAESNSTTDINKTNTNKTNMNKTDINKTTQKDTNKTALNKNIQKAIEEEKKFKKEQKFYMGDDYNLSEQKVDKDSVKKVPLIEPEYDFDMTDVYSD